MMRERGGKIVREPQVHQGSRAAEVMAGAWLGITGEGKRKRVIKRGPFRVLTLLEFKN